MKEYICKTCNTRFSTSGNQPPPTPNWADGHKCELVEYDRPAPPGL